MRVRAEVELAATAVADVRVELSGGEVGVAEHFLDAAEISSAFEQVRGERVPEQVRVDPFRFETRLLGQPAQHEEHSCARQASAFRVEKELRPVAPVEVRTSAREIAPERIRRGPAKRHDPLLCALAGSSAEALLEIDVCLPRPTASPTRQPGPESNSTKAPSRS